MRLVLVGAVDFSCHCLEELVRHGADVVAVVTLEPQAARGHADYADLGEAARRHGIPVHRTTDINQPGTVARLASLRPDVICVFGWSQILGPSVLGVAPCIGSHPALLPKHRGRHPLIWALVEGLSESGLTFFYLNERADAGDILWQRAFPISPADDVGTLYARIKALASEAIAELLPALAAGTAPRRRQDERLATYWHRRTPADGEIHWDASSWQIYNLIRALTRPYVGAHTYLQGEKLVVWRSELVAGGRTGRAAPGTIVSVQGRDVEVATGDGMLRLVEYDAPNGQRLSAGQRMGERRERAGHLCAS